MSKTPAKQAVHLADTPACACLNLRMTARAVTQMFDQVLKPTGLKATQFSVLAAVGLAGRTSMTSIAHALVMDRTTLTRNLKPLMKGGYIESSTGDDRRQRPIQLTAKGEAALVQALPLWRTAQGRIVDAVGEARWRGMAKMLEETIRLAQ
jgi:DNA-binding MarR family transcriptional regulator